MINPVKSFLTHGPLVLSSGYKGNTLNSNKAKEIKFSAFIYVVILLNNVGICTVVST